MDSLNLIYGRIDFRKTWETVVEFPLILNWNFAQYIPGEMIPEGFEINSCIITREENGMLELSYQLHDESEGGGPAGTLYLDFIRGDSLSIFDDAGLVLTVPMGGIEERVLIYKKKDGPMEFQKTI